MKGPATKVLAAVGLVGVLAGCGGGSASTAAAPTVTGPAPTVAPPPTTSRPASRTTPAKPPVRPTPPPSPVDGSCPYMASSQVQDTIGQHISRSTVTPTKPYPGCAFYRPNGERAADVQVSVLATAQAAQARAIALGGRSANPVNVGDGGVVVLTDTGATLAASKGKALVVIRINQRISLEARELATYVVAHL
jgi:hypothetical protein